MDDTNECTEAEGVVPIKEHERDIQPAGIQTSTIAEHTHNTTPFAVHLRKMYIH